MGNLESNTQINIQIIRSDRRTISLEITRSGQAIIRAPKSRFWAHVGDVLPDYRNAKQWLKEQGGALMLRMHEKE